MIWFDEKLLCYFASFKGMVAKTTFNRYIEAKQWLIDCEENGGYLNV